MLGTRLYPLISLFVLLTNACTTPGDSAETGSNQDTAACSSGEEWTRGNDGSSQMNPGEDCVACHASGEGPNYTLAGTVMGDYDDPDDCNGVGDVVVRVIDADDNVLELTTNSAGNFYTNDKIAPPYTIELEHNGATSSMASAQSEGGCASCHTAAGAEGAPGRIVAP
jgi:mono/diheme cytochrome c family protein